MEPRRRVRVLVADDDRFFAEMLTAALGEREGIEIVAHAGDGAEAVALARSLRPDVVLMDINMPRMNGFEATARIRKKWRSVCVVMVTSSTDPADVERARRAGASGYVTKGCSSRDLVAAVLDAARPKIRAFPPALRLVSLRTSASM
jgi:DNA-binding NarL/FixJ family response regulator